LIVNELLTRIRREAALHPDAAAIKDECGEIDYAGLVRTLDPLVNTLDGERIGLLLDNGIPWACLDLAILQRGAVCVPMPGFFSDDQLRHLVSDADLDRIVTDQPERVVSLLQLAPTDVLRISGRDLSLFQRSPQKTGPVLPRGTIKVTYTSGTTGQPKGVCLSGETLQSVVRALCQAVSANRSDRCLSLLPLSTLLENITGLYAPLWTGASAQLPSLASCGFTGSSGLQIDQLFAALVRAKPTITVLVPQLLKAIVGGIATGLTAPDSLRFVAVGGAPISESLLQQARLFGLPVYQGFGLSEAGSVACLNLPGAERQGSVGKPLSHIGVRIAGDGEVMVNGPLFLGYLGAFNRVAKTEWSTGDLGYLDPDGYLFLTGRKKTAYATAFGRNVSPEWVESALTGHPYIVQAAVFGESQALNIAVLVSRSDIAPQVMNQAVAVVNQILPDYARIGGWIAADHPFSPANGLANGAGCIQRQAIHDQYRDRIEQLYGTEEIHAVS
jgi:long-subunit acyl-CoA synthetase (AMP-forming)